MQARLVCYLILAKRVVMVKVCTFISYQQKGATATTYSVNEKLEVNKEKKKQVVMLQRNHTASIMKAFLCLKTLFSLLSEKCIVWLLGATNC